MNLFAMTKNLCATHGTPGREKTVADVIEKEARKYTDDIVRDALGNLIVRKRGNRVADSTIMLAAHMDEVGFMVCGITEEGLIKLTPAGGLYGHTLAGREVFFVRSKIKGILGKAPLHLSKNRQEVPSLDDMYADIGAQDKEDAEKHIRLGDSGVFDAQLKDLGDNLVMGKALDDRLGCAILLELMSKELSADVVFAFTVQEELGLRGAGTAAFAVKPGIGIVVDVAGAADNAGFCGTNAIARVGKGPVLSFADRATYYDMALFEMACQIADDSGIPWQTKTRISGATDAGAIHLAAEGARVIGVSVAGRNIHTAVSAVSKSDAEQTVILIEKILEQIANVR